MIYILDASGIPLAKIQDILGQVDEKATLGYIYNPNTEEENREIMNSAQSKKYYAHKCTYSDKQKKP